MLNSCRDTKVTCVTDLQTVGSTMTSGPESNVIQLLQSDKDIQQGVYLTQVFLNPCRNKHGFRNT